MEIGQQLKQRRSASGLSQEELAERIFVSRQTLSNWENGKTYPDINSLLRLSAIFNISLDELVKGDIKEMEEQIRTEDIQRFRRESKVFGVLMAIMVLSAAPLTLWNFWQGLTIWICICAVTIFYSYRVEKLKKQHDIHTYKEILAFLEGKRLDDLKAAEERGKRPYQKFLLVLASGLLGFFCSLLMLWLTKLL